MRDIRSSMSAITSGATAQSAFATQPTVKDPYRYQVGFGNSFATEALPGVLPEGQNNPQKVKYTLYTEQMTGAAFVAPRAENRFAWLYRIRPSVAHKGFTRLPNNPNLESNFLPTNKNVHVGTPRVDWEAFKLPADSQRVDWVEGLKTIAGSGEPTLREGLAIHMYLANQSMDKRAFCNADGDMLILPQHGRLDIQTEFGKMMVRPGELCVIQRGMKFKVILPDGPSRGYIQEIFGTHFELPELGALGGNGLANRRDFEIPVAGFDIDQGSWEIVYKVSGHLHASHQEHTPFDVVAWHGNYVPYKYALEKFVFVGNINKDHIDPSCNCVLTAKSKHNNAPLVDFLIFAEKWDVATNTFRPPYYHRNASTEFIGAIKNAPESGIGLQPGGAYFDLGFSPHGMSDEIFKAASENVLTPEITFKDTLLIMFESSMQFTITDYAMNCSERQREEQPRNYEAHFMDHLDEIKADLKAAGLPPLGSNQ